MWEWRKAGSEITPYQLNVAKLQGPRRRMEKTSWTAHLITKHQLFTWHLFKAAQKKRCTGRRAFSQCLSLQNLFYLVVVLIPRRSTRALLTQCTIYSKKKISIFPYTVSYFQMESVSGSWCRELCGLRRNFCCSFICTAFQPHYKQHQTLCIPVPGSQTQFILYPSGKMSHLVSGDKEQIFIVITS